MNGMRTTNRSRRGLREPEISHLARADQRRHRADRVVGRYVRVDTMLVVEVDVGEAEALERGVTGAADVLRGAVDAAEGSVLIAQIAEFRGEHHLIAAF